MPPRPLKQPSASIKIVLRVYLKIVADVLFESEMYENCFQRNVLFPFQALA